MSAHRDEAHDMTQVRLPEAPTAHYVRWMAYWREVESAMLDRPRIERVASKEAAPFLEGSIARFISAAATDIMRQARAAEEQGHKTVAPELSAADPTVFGDVADYLRRRSTWLDEFGTALGVNPLEEHLRDLRVACIRVVDQVARDR